MMRTAFKSAAVIAELAVADNLPSMTDNSAEVVARHLGEQVRSTAATSRARSRPQSYRFGRSDHCHG
jgi:hypothetical protein